MTSISGQILQFKISLIGSNPLIWRRIQVPDSYSFHDLHVAIQDAMGWEDHHLHQFIIYTGDKKLQQRTLIGIPDGSLGDDSALAELDTKVLDFLVKDEQSKIIYEYDFGDSWEHLIEFEGYFKKDPAVKEYPICIDGAMACPPEDSGGIYGYYDMIDAIKDKNHPQYQEYLEWLGYVFNPDKFNKAKVKFRNSKTSLKKLLARFSDTY